MICPRSAKKKPYFGWQTRGSGEGGGEGGEEEKWGMTAFEKSLVPFKVTTTHLMSCDLRSTITEAYQPRA